MPDLQSIRYGLRGSVTKWFERPAVSTLVFLRITPSVATLIGTVIAIVAAYFASEGEFLIAGILVLVGATFDLLDGGIARATDSVSKRGALMDSVFDRVSELAVLIGLAMFYSSAAESNQTAVLLATIAMAGSVLVSYIRARAEGLGVKGTAGFLTRPERVFIVVIFLAIGYPMIALWILGVGTPLSAAWRFIEAWRSIDSE